MTTVVPTDGFNVPGAQPNIPPQNMQPGVVVPPSTETAQPAPTVQPAPTSPDLAAAIAALTAALPQPVQAPAVEEPESGNSDDLNSYDVAGIDDPIIRSMATVLQTVGKDIDLNRAIGAALERGDASLVDVAYLKEKGGANAEQLITISKEIVKAVEAKATEITARVHALAGNEDAWNASAASFNQAAPQELRLVVKQMLDSKQPNLIEAGAKIVVQFGKNSGMIPNPAPLVQTGAASMPSATAMDKYEFQAELRKLDPQDRQYTQKRNELFARRQLGKKLGK